MGVSRMLDQAGSGEEAALAARLAVGAIRRALHGARECAPAPHGVLSLHRDLLAAGALFRGAHRAMLVAQGTGLLVAPPGSLVPTRHERRLLRATAAAQAGDEALADNYLFGLTPQSRVRPLLARAVIALATGLALGGFWFGERAAPEALARARPPRCPH